ncbi:MAG: RluA family pseudouridine synthase [Desulfobulbaceae bacterium]|jgi:23S rRNA pseudouridine1911/1915/1917 synthase|nr:RluA family pseudouridine synthase [Desulfobulbaceae bacterium]
MPSPPPDGQAIDLTADAVSARLRLDQFLALHIPDTSRAVVAAALRAGALLVDGQIKKCGHRLRGGERICGKLPAPPPSQLTAEEMPLTIVYEDETLLIIIKPPGLVVHPGSGNLSGTLANGLLHHRASLRDVGDAARPGLVHRLDKDTSGLLVVAKNERAHRLLVEQFQRRQVKKEYLALAHGHFTAKAGRIEAPIGRHPVNRQKMTVLPSGRQAVSNWQVEEEFTGFALLRLHIETGRTHQIRVHLAHLGNPVAGDPVYGRATDAAHFPRQMLHAERLAFTHPLSGAEMTFTAPLWPDFQAALAALRQSEALELSSRR